MTLIRWLAILITILVISACGGGSDGGSGNGGPTYYIDATGGSDGNAGTSPTTAWQTFSRLDSASYSSTTTILLKRGEVWHESLNLTHSNIVVDAFGTGELPRIDGSRIITNWVPVAGNLYSASVTLGPDAALGNLSANGNLLSFVPWTTDFTTTFAGAPEESFALEYPNTLYMKTATAPVAASSFGASVLLRGVYASGLSNITIRNLEITRVSLNGVEFKNCINCLVTDSVVTQSGGAVIGLNATTPPDYLYAGNGIDFSNSCADGGVSNVTVAEIFDSCVAVELYDSNQTAANMQINSAQLDRCGFAGIEVSVLRNVDTVNSTIDNLAIAGATITLAGDGWSGRRYGIDGHGIRIVADTGAGSMSGISVTTSQVSGSAGDGIKLAGEIGTVGIHRVKLQTNSGDGVNVAAADATSLLLNLSSSILDRNTGNGVSYNAPQSAGLMIYHNTFYDNPINLAIFNQAGLADIRNNLYYNDNGGTHFYSTSALAGPSIDHNCYNDMINMIGYDNIAYSTLSLFNTATGFETGGIGNGVVGLSNPASGGFTLLEGSDCRSLGDPTTGVSTDYRGADYNTPPASGAFEYP